MPEDLVVTKTAQTSWEKVYTWDVEKSVDKSQLNLKTGETGTVQWKVDVTQTGSAVRNARVSGHDQGAQPERHGGDGCRRDGRARHGGLAGAVVDCDGTAGEPNTSTGLTVPANGDLICAYTASRRLDDRRHEQGDRHGDTRGVDVSDSGTARLQVRRDCRPSRSTRPSRRSTARTRGTGSTGTRRSRTTSSSRARAGPDERRRPARRQPVDAAGRDRLRARHRLGERDRPLLDARLRPPRSRRRRTSSWTCRWRRTRRRRCSS